MSMSSKVRVYLRTLRNEWGLTQKELASLLPKGDRNRVRCVELGEAQPNAGEILAYSLIFGLPGQAIFPKFTTGVDEAVMRGAYHLYESVEGDGSPGAARKRELLDLLRARAITNLHRAGV